MTKETGNSNDNDEPKRSAHNVPLVPILIVVVVLSILALWIVCTVTARPKYALPDLNDIASIRADFCDRTGSPVTPREVKFEVPKECWAQIFSCLEPAEYDSSPSNWKALGVMSVRCIDGEELLIQ